VTSKAGKYPAGGGILLLVLQSQEDVEGARHSGVVDWVERTAERC